MRYNFSNKELKLLNSTLAIKMMLQNEEVEPKKVLRFVNYEKEVEKLQVELIKLQHWVISQKQTRRYHF
jgi:polyphosphate kinase 2 (PPK2 family)